MLIRFEVSNHRSIKNPIELSMVAIDRDRPAARSFNSLHEKILPVAGIYGSNASGKTNTIKSLAWLSFAVRSSLRQWESSVPREPFRFADGAEEPSSFEVELIVAGVRYNYQLEVDDQRVIFEGLYSYPERRRRTLFERTQNGLNIRRGLGAISGARELLTPNTLALSAAMRFEKPEIRDFARALTRIVTINFRRRTPLGAFGYATSLFPTGPSSTNQLLMASDTEIYQDVLFGNSSRPVVNRTAIVELLRYADLGIEDTEVVGGDLSTDQSDATYSRENRRRIRLLHKVGSQKLPLELEEESAGTQSWYHLIGPVLVALSRGDTILFDEIDSSLHPLLSARLIELFQRPETNPNNAQLICTTHDTTLLRQFNRDEVWMAEKNSLGETTLTALAEFGGDKVRHSTNLENGYLQGRYKGVPRLDSEYLWRAVTDALVESE